MKDFESRIFAGQEVRAGESGDEMALVGYCATFNTLSHDLGGFKEQIAPPAFDRAMRDKHDVRFLLNHDPNKILGRTSAGTLHLATDAKGLLFRCQLDPNQQWHRDLWQSVKRGDITQCSFCFRVPGPECEKWDEATDDRGQRFSRRTLLDVNLLDASAVTYPAYEGTSVSARNLAPSVRKAMQTISHEAWKRIMCQRAKQSGDDIEAQRLLEGINAGRCIIRWSTDDDGNEIPTVDLMTDDEYAERAKMQTEVLRRRSAQVGREILLQRIEEARKHPSGVWDPEQRAYVSELEILQKELDQLCRLS